MADHIQVPVVEHDGYRWAALAFYGKDHEITGEKQACLNQKYSFKGGHRVRIYKIKQNVYWKIPSTVTLDISNVPARRVPQR
jgi:predicted RNA-binding protein associated with RNAse of E/G family